jgi:hypothetical protein
LGSRPWLAKVHEKPGISGARLSVASPQPLMLRGLRAFHSNPCCKWVLIKPRPKKTGPLKDPDRKPLANLQMKSIRPAFVRKVWQATKHRKRQRIKCLSESQASILSEYKSKKQWQTLYWHTFCVE